MTRAGPAARAHHGLAPDAAIDRQARRGWGWLLLVPGMLWLAVFFVFPTIQLFFTSLYDPSGSLEPATR